MYRKFMVFLIAGFFLFPQTKLDLDKAISFALSHSPVYLQAEKQLESTRAKARQATSIFLPKVNLQGQDILKKKVFTIELPPFFPGDKPKRVKMDFTRKYQFGLNITQPIFSSGQLRSSYSIAQLQAKAEEENFRQKRLDLILQVKKAFYSVMLAKKAVEIQRESSRLAYNHYKQVKSLYEVGSATKFELLQARVNWENTKPELIKAENNLKLAMLSLKSLIGMEGNFEVEGELKFIPMEIGISELERYLLSHSPALLAMRYRKEAAAKGVQLAKSKFGPTVALSFDYNFRSDNFNFKASNWEDYYTLALVISMPLFSGFSRVEEVRSSTNLYYAAKFGEKALRDKLLLQLRSAYRKAKEAQASYISARDTVNKAREGVRLAEVSYRESLVTSLEVEQARLSLKMAEMNMYNALYQYRISLAEIESITGYKFGGER